MKHLENSNILCDREHGFRSKWSYETQLLPFQRELLEAMEKGSLSDIIMMEFSKAFNKVPHQWLMDKIRYFGVNHQVICWIQCFLSGRRQRVLVDGKESTFTEVLSVVPQGIVLCPVWFLLFINDLPNDIKSSALIFADDCVVHRAVKSPEDQAILQKVLTTSAAGN